MTVDGPARRAVAPHFAQQFFAREYAVRVVGESDQQLVFLGGELDRVSSDADVPCAEVDRERRGAVAGGVCIRRGAERRPRARGALGMRTAWR
jgi:hypothetical protein